MKDIGIKVEHIALMYAILPFTIFLAPPLVGFLADKLGKLNFLAANDCAEVLYRVVKRILQVEFSLNSSAQY